MKNFRKLSIIVLAIIAVLSLTLFVACSEEPTDTSEGTTSVSASVSESASTSQVKQVTVGFETNGGSSATAQTVEEGSKVTLPSVTRNGYDFLGWYDNSAFTGTALSAGAQVTATADATYYAAWEVASVKYTVTLDVDGGTLAQNSVSLKEGANVYDAVKDLVPVKTGHLFGAWYINGSELSHNLRMGTSAITLTAKYKTQYTVEIWSETLDGASYEKTETITLYDYEGATVTYEENVTGFVQTNNDAAITSIVVGADASANVLKYYYDRETYRLTYNSNFAQYEIGAENLTSSVSVLYGQEVEVPEHLFEFNGYYLLGWATSQSGDVVYKTNYLANNLYNGEESAAVENDKVAPVRNTVLYAKWYKGYKDMFGGSDNLFRFDAGWDIYLERGGVFFLGEYDASRNAFTFYDEKDDIVVSGKLNNNGTYCYSSDVRSSYSAMLYRAGRGLDNTEKIYFDALDGITYSKMNDAGTTDDSNGIYTINDKGEYVVTYTSGPLAGTRMTMMIGTVTSDNNAVNVFAVRNDEEYNMPELVRYVFIDGRTTYYLAYQIKLDGYGVATLYTAQNHESSTTYNYLYNDETGLYDLYNSNNQVAGSFGIFNISVAEATKGYLFYYEEFDNQFVGDDGLTLTLDGFMNAVYSDGTNTQEGHYVLWSDDTAFGDYIVNFYNANGDVTKFIISTVTTEVSEEVEGEDGEMTTVTTEVTEYKAVRKNNGYAEYYYHGNTGVYYGPLFVFEGDAENTVLVYTYGGGEYTLAAKGVYVEGENGRYVLTLNEYYLEEAPAIMGDLNDIKSIEFATTAYTIASTSGSNSYQVHYWYSFTDKEDQTHTSFEVSGSSGTTLFDLSVKYTSETDGSIEINGGFLTYTFNKDVYIAQYSTNGNVVYINTESGYIFFELDRENMTFDIVRSLPYRATVAVNGLNVSGDSMSFDGKGGATYTTTETVETEEGEETVTVAYVGAVTATEEESLTGFVVYEFEGATVAAEGEEAETLTFKYIQVYLSSNTTYYVFKFDGAYFGEYESEEDGYLVLDGFGFAAEYTDADGNNYTGMYYLREEGSIVLSLGDGEYKYVDLAEGTFTAKGDEFGSYFLYDNQYLDDVMFRLDGYGKAVVRGYDEEQSEWLDVDENAVYEVDGEEIILTYTDGAKTITYYLKADVYEYNDNSYNILVARHKEVAYTFVNGDDWSVLRLDAFGNAVRYTKMGVKQEGTYMIITDNLFYFVTDDQTDAAVYVFDSAKASAEKIQLSTRGYFTEDLEALLFSQYGFATFHNTTRYYYNVDKDGLVTIYRRDMDDENANEYGFVAETFGQFKDTIVYNEKTYYANDGYRITFTREAETKGDYPVRETSASDDMYPLEELTFAPTGEAEFSVTGSVMFNGTAYTATVVRAMGDQGEYEMYVNVGNMYFYIEVSYKGEDDNYYKVTALYTRNSYYSYTYVYYARMYAMFGMTLPDRWGRIYVENVYAKDGSVEDRRVTAHFDDFAELYDYTGANVGFDNAEYSFMTSGTSGVYVIDFAGEDGYDYTLYFTTTTLANTYCYRIIALTRNQTFEYDGYKVEVARIIGTDLSENYTMGDIWELNLYQLNGEEYEQIAISGRFARNGINYYLSRETDEDGKILASKYFYVSFNDGEAFSEETEEHIQPYANAQIVSEDVQILYTQNGDYYIEIGSSFGALILGVKEENGYTNYIVYDTAYDEETEVYTISLSSGRLFRATLAGDYAVINEVERVFYERAEGDEENYIAFGTLAFEAVEEKEFTLAATVVYNNSTLRGTINRTYDEINEEYVTILTIGNLQAYLELASETDDAGETTYSYTIKALRSEVKYVDIEYILDADAEDNTYGTITVTREYGVDGTAAKSFLNATFGKDRAFPETLAELTNVEFALFANNVYVAEVGKYSIYFFLYTADEFNAYEIYALVEQNSWAIEGYVVEIDAIIASSNPSLVGKIWALELYLVDGEDLVAAGVTDYFDLGETLYFVVREEDEDGVITASTFYYIEMTVDEDGKYTGVKAVTKEVVSVYYDAEGENFVEFSVDKGVLTVNDKVADKCEYDQTTATYTVTVGEDVYTVKISEGKAVVTKVVEEEPEQGEGE